MMCPRFAFFPRFDIVLMKEGRMKGQAFVGLPSEQSAEKALRETNGYVLYDKPLVVVSFLSPLCKMKQGQGFLWGMVEIQVVSLFDRVYLFNV